MGVKKQMKTAKALRKCHGTHFEEEDCPLEYGHMASM